MKQLLMKQKKKNITTPAINCSIDCQNCQRQPKNNVRCCHEKYMATDDIARHVFFTVWFKIWTSNYEKLYFLFGCVGQKKNPKLDVNYSSFLWIDNNFHSTDIFLIISRFNEHLLSQRAQNRCVQSKQNHNFDIVSSQHVKYFSWAKPECDQSIYV